MPAYVIGGEGQFNVYIDTMDRTIYVGTEHGDRYQNTRWLNERDGRKLLDIAREMAGASPDWDRPIEQGWEPYDDRLHLTFGQHEQGDMVCEMWQPGGRSGHIAFVTRKNDGTRVHPRWLDKGDAKRLVQKIYEIFDVQQDTANEAWDTPADLTREQAVQLIEQTAQAHGLTVTINGDPPIIHYRDSSATFS